ncbi:MAG: hypothetical protein ACP5O0_06775 [Acidimicrobiales bacterium]
MSPDIIGGLARSVARLVFGGEPDRCVPRGDYLVEAGRGERAVLVALPSGSDDLARTLWRALTRDCGPQIGDVVMVEPSFPPRSVRGSPARSSQDLWSADALAHLGIKLWRYGKSGGELELRNRELNVTCSSSILIRHRFPTVALDDDLVICSFEDGFSLEYRGLAVAIDRTGSSQFEVGVSERDREARNLAFGESYDRVSELVRTLSEVRTRRVGGSSHPIAQVAPERWLRHEISKTDAYGPKADEWVEIGGIDDNRRRAYALANGTLLAMTVGPDPTLIFELGSVYAALRRSSRDLSGHVSIYTPEQDRIEGYERLFGRSTLDISVVSVSKDWQRRGEEA